MTGEAQHYEHVSGPLIGRLILLVTAYAPVALIAGLRGLPELAGWFAVGLGGAGILLWTLFLWWLPRAQSRTTKVDEVELIDSEVTGYVVSLLLPLVAASAPGLNDWLAYAVCAVLVLLVAFRAEFWAVNPIAYAFDMRAGKAVVDGKRHVVLIRGDAADARRVVLVNRLGVTLILGVAPPSPEGSNAG